MSAPASADSPWASSAPEALADATPPEEPELNYLRSGYKAFFHHADAPMRRLCALLREGRAPSEIVREHGGANAGATP